MQGRRLAVIVALSALLGGCVWFESLVGGGSDDSSAAAPPAEAAASNTDAKGPADAPQMALLVSYMTDFQVGLDLSGGADRQSRAAAVPARTVPPLPVQRPAIIPAAFSPASVGSLAEGPESELREADFKAGLRFAGTPLTEVLRNSSRPSAAPLAMPLDPDGYSLADALRDAQWRSETARRLETLFR